MKKSIVVMVVALVFGIGGYTLGSYMNPQEKCVNADISDEDTKDDEPTIENKNKKDLINHTFTRTYNINHIAESNDYEYIYITIRGFQDEEIETVKVKRELFKDVKVGDNYEIKFSVTNNSIEDNLKSIFENAKIVTAKKTDKTGLEQVFEPIE